MSTSGGKVGTSATMHPWRLILSVIHPNAFHVEDVSSGQVLRIPTSLNPGEPIILVDYDEADAGQAWFLGGKGPESN
ncbi:hypothetical protein PAXINDRAFT_95691 [Paxillus involutus ATCC 200175]|nr:hypothetical protein PAXINDRAFT_95691 [Paxillus involutus ATCC 200175]